MLGLFRYMLQLIQRVKELDIEMVTYELVARQQNAGIGKYNKGHPGWLVKT